MLIVSTLEIALQRASATELYEIAAYKSLVSLAQEQNDTEAVSGLTTSLDDEIEMSDRLDDNIEPVTLQFTTLSERGLHGKN